MPESEADGPQLPTRVIAARPEVPDSQRERMLAEVERRLLGGAEQPLPQIARYEMLHRLGSGGAGDVYAAWDPDLQRKVAIKLLRASVHGGEDSLRSRDRLLREAQALAHLAHPNIVHVYDVGEHAGEVYLVMELISGQDLRQWLAASPRAWREVLAVFIGAGKGLEAAHAHGIVHRDFKPANVLVGADGFVRVLDFGLARAAGEPASETTAEPLPPNVLSSPLTQTGAVMGTPAYMAPEQHRGERGDARADQYSFCIALFEGLYGVRPFAGESAGDLHREKASARLPDVPRRGVPRRVHRALLRGLGRRPADRFETMGELLAELESARGRRWLRWGAPGAAALAAGLLTWGLSRAGPGEAEPGGGCEVGTEQLDGVWDAERAAALEAALHGSGAPFADSTAQRVRVALDDYAGRWLAHRREACLDTHVRRLHSVAVLDLRAACLDRARQRLRHTVDTLTGPADAGLVDHALQAVFELPRLEPCSDIAALTAEVAPPTDPAIAARVAEIRAELDRLQVDRAAGRYDAARGGAKRAAGLASSIDYAPLRAETDLLVGLSLVDTGQYADAEEQLRRAFFAAVAAQHDRVAREASTALIDLVGYRLGRLEEALEWAEHAHAAATRSGDELAVAEYLVRLGVVHGSRGEHAPARRAFEQALEIYGRRLEPDALEVARVRSGLGNVTMEQRELDVAAEHLGAALTIREMRLGPEHPLTLDVRSNLANLAFVRGDFETALRTQEEVLALGEKRLGSAHPNLARTMASLANTLQMLDRFDDARTWLERALAILEQAQGPDHPETASTRNNLAVALLQGGRAQEALAGFERGTAAMERALGPQNPKLATGLIGIAEAHLALGDAAAALPAIERAVALLEPSTVRRSVVAQARFTRAKILWELGRRAAARSSASASAAAYREAGGDFAPAAADVERWLAVRAG